MVVPTIEKLVYHACVRPMHGPTSMKLSSSTTSIPPTIPFHVAQAYGVRPAAQSTRGVEAAKTPPAVSQASGPASKLPSAAQRLVGATVAGRVDFSGDSPKQSVSSGVLNLYAHPADKNAAATAVSIGRSLDVRG